jgi:beta-mannanase
VAAWRRVVGIFRDVGARNVAFVWCPSTDAGNWRAYYPGADLVDWIGVDGYVRSADPAAATSAFDRVFGTFYDEYAGEGRPIMVAETGALPGAQGPYLSSLTTVIPQRFPLVRALAYFDAPGPRGAWSLDGDGRRAFAALAQSAQFSFHG